ncbi:MAG: hypothetical protein M3069_14795 [Chloroflexota bacterium]|nr:hypothetical protein [Chloroflexota bacterium]
MRKLLEAFFRHKLLLLLPPILIPAIVGPVALLTNPPVYLASETIWVDRPTYLNYNDNSTPWLTPSQIQSARVSELLQTRAFQMEVAKRTTSLAPLIGSVAGEQRIQTLLTRSVVVGRGGDHVLLIQVQVPTAQLAYELAGAVVDAYQEKNAVDQSDQASAAVSYYQSRIQEAEKQLARSGQDLRRYLATQAANSDATGLADSSIANLPAATALDPRLGALQATVQTSQTDLNQARSALTQAQRDASAALEGQQLGFQVLDPPVMPISATRQLRKIAIYPIAAIAAGLALSAILLVLIVASDRSVRSEADVMTGVRVLGVIPALKLKGARKKLGPVATRRAIGAAAGTALPMPGAAK